MLPATTTHETPALNLPIWALKMLYSLMSKHTRQLFIISSLNEQMNHYNREVALSASRLNYVMDLAYRSDAVKFPAACCGTIWNKSGIEKVIDDTVLMKPLDDAGLNVLADNVIRAAPKWLHVERLADIRAAVRSLLLYRQRNLSAQMAIA